MLIVGFIAVLLIAIISSNLVGFQVGLNYLHAYRLTVVVLEGKPNHAASGKYLKAALRDVGISLVTFYHMVSLCPDLELFYEQIEVDGHQLKEPWVRLRKGPPYSD